MTNELEKRFFNTFGIKEKELEYPDNFTYYPEITDRILLELICIASQPDVYIEIEGKDVETIKNNLLENFIHFKRIIPKHKIRILFEEKQ